MDESEEELRRREQKGKDCEREPESVLGETVSDGETLPGSETSYSSQTSTDLLATDLHSQDGSSDRDSSTGNQVSQVDKVVVTTWSEHVERPSVIPVELQPSTSSLLNRADNVSALQDADEKNGKRKRALEKGDQVQETAQQVKNLQTDVGDIGGSDSNKIKSQIPKQIIEEVISKTQVAAQRPWLEVQHSSIDWAAENIPLSSDTDRETNLGATVDHREGTEPVSSTDEVLKTGVVDENVLHGESTGECAQEMRTDNLAEKINVMAGIPVSQFDTNSRRTVQEESEEANDVHIQTDVCGKDTNHSHEKCTKKRTARERKNTAAKRAHFDSTVIPQDKSAKEGRHKEADSKRAQLTSQDNTNSMTVGTSSCSESEQSELTSSESDVVSKTNQSTQLDRSNKTSEKQNEHPAKGGPGSSYTPPTLLSLTAGQAQLSEGSPQEESEEANDVHIQTDVCGKDTNHSHEKCTKKRTASERKNATDTPAHFDSTVIPQDKSAEEGRHKEVDSKRAQPTSQDNTNSINVGTSSCSESEQSEVTSSESDVVSKTNQLTQSDRSNKTSKKQNEHPPKGESGSSDNPLTLAEQAPLNEEPTDGHFYRKPVINDSKTRGPPRQERETRSQTKDDGKYVTVTFHAMLSPHFKIKKNTRIYIEGDGPVFEGWNHPCVPIEQTKSDNVIMLSGEWNVPAKLAHRKCSYKYVVGVNNDKKYEELVEFKSFSGYTDRALAIPKDVVAAGNGSWDMYDGFVYPQFGYLGFLKTLRIDFNADRRDFVAHYFPKWTGFHISTTTDCNMSPIAAVRQLGDLVDHISKPWTSRSGYIAQNSVYDLRLDVVIRDCLMPKISANISVLENKDSDAASIVAAILSSLVIIHVFVEHKINLTKERFNDFLSCLKLPADRTVCTLLTLEIDGYDRTVLRDLSASLVKFYNKTEITRTCAVNWLQSLPLLHFVRGDSKPFEEIPVLKVINYDNWKWWGLGSLNVRKFIERITASEVNVILPALESSFTMDRLLPRSVLLLTPIETYSDLLHYEQFRILDVCASLRKMLPDRNLDDDMTNCLTSLFSDVNEMLKRISVESATTSSFDENNLLLETLVKLVENMKGRIKLHQMRVIRRLVECFSTLVVAQDAAIEQTESMDENFSHDKDFVKKLLAQACGAIKFIIKDKCRGELRDILESQLSIELQAWSELLSVEAPDSFHDHWHRVLFDCFESRVKKIADPMRVIEIFCQSDKQELIHHQIAECLSDAAFKAVDQVMKPGQGQQQKAFELLSDRKHCAFLLNRMLEKTWPVKDEDDLLLTHLLTRPTWPGFLTFFGSGGTNKIFLPEEGRVKIVLAETFLVELIRSVHTGQVTVTTLGMLKKHERQFLVLCDIVLKNQNTTESIPGLRKTYHQRIRELDEFVEQKEQLQYFLGLYDECLSERETLRERLEVDFTSHAICDVSTTTKDGIIVVMFFNLTDGIRKMLENVRSFRGSQIFFELWEKYIRKHRDNPVTMAVILQSVYDPLMKELTSIQQQFVNGDILLKDVQKCLKMFDNDEEKLQTDLEKLLTLFSDPAGLCHVSKKQLRANIQKFRNYKGLFRAKQAAQAIIKLRDTSRLQGDFAEVEQIFKVVEGDFSSQPLKSISNSLLKAGTLLADITPDRVACLKAFTEAEDLVNWLKENIQDQQQLKVFVDLAMISAGESDVEIDRISYMHTSCLGFSSLIFKLEKSHGFNDLMELCKPVWQALEANAGLPRQLDMTSRRLSWLQQIKESHGSVALTTLLQVEAINACGVYHIANYELLKSKNGEPSLEHTVCLVVPEDSEKRTEERIYSLDEVRDVQSKLMLIAGKAENGKEEVDQFLEVFEGVLRMMSLYVQLCEVGQIDYLTWKNELRCSKDEHKRAKLIDEIRKTCSQMENDLTEWKGQVDGIRQGCYALNHYTMKQILKLRKDLASTCTGLTAVNEMPLQTSMLLQQCVCNDAVEPVVLASILEKVIPETQVFISAEGLSGDQSDQEMLQDDEEISIRRPRRQNSMENFVDARTKLEDMGHSHEVAIAALGACGRHAHADELVLWAINAEDKDIETFYQRTLDDPQLRDLLEDYVDVNEIELSHEEQDDVETDPSDLNRPMHPHHPAADHFVKNERDTYLSLPALADVLQELASSGWYTCF